MGNRYLSLHASVHTDTVLSGSLCLIVLCCLISLVLTLHNQAEHTEGSVTQRVCLTVKIIYIYVNFVGDTLTYDIAVYVLFSVSLLC